MLRTVDAMLLFIASTTALNLPNMIRPTAMPQRFCSPVRMQEQPVNYYEDKLCEEEEECVLPDDDEFRIMSGGPYCKYWLVLHVAPEKYPDKLRNDSVNDPVDHPKWRKEMGGNQLLAAFL